MMILSIYLEVIMTTSEQQRQPLGRVLRGCTGTNSPGYHTTPKVNGAGGCRTEKLTEPASTETFSFFQKRAKIV